MRPSAKFKPMSLCSPARHLDKSKLFESLEDSQLTTDSSSIMGGARETFVPRRSIKKLAIKPKVCERSRELRSLLSMNALLRYNNIICSNCCILLCSLSLIQPPPLTRRSHPLCHAYSSSRGLLQSPLVAVYHQPTGLHLKLHLLEPPHPHQQGQRTPAWRVLSCRWVYQSSSLNQHQSGEPALSPVMCLFLMLLPFQYCLLSFSE